MLGIVVAGFALLRPVGVSDAELDTAISDRLSVTASAEDLSSLELRIAELERENRELEASLLRLEDSEEPPPPPLTVADIADRALQSVVTVETPSGIGTGFAIEDPTGDIYIITNYHVVESVWIGGSRTVDIVHGETRLSRRIVNVNVSNDLAAIGPVESILPLITSRALPTVGTDIVVIGSPYGLDGTVVTGVVSALREERIQFSAPVSPGNSGGPLIDGDGIVVGVVVEKVSTQAAEGLSFAIPMDVTCRVIIAC